MSLHVNDLAWLVWTSLSGHAHPAGQLKVVGEPEFVRRDEEQGYPERDGIWRLVAHGDLRDIEIVLVVRDARDTLAGSTDERSENG